MMLVTVNSYSRAPSRRVWFICISCTLLCICICSHLRSMLWIWCAQTGSSSTWRSRIARPAASGSSRASSGSAAARTADSSRATSTRPIRRSKDRTGAMWSRPSVSSRRVRRALVASTRTFFILRSECAVHLVMVVLVFVLTEALNTYRISVHTGDVFGAGTHMLSDLLLI